MLPGVPCCSAWRTLSAWYWPWPSSIRLPRSRCARRYSHGCCWRPGGNACACACALRELRRRGRNTRTVAIAGVNLAAFELANELNAMPWTGLVFKGFYDDCPAEGLVSETPFEVLGSLARLVADVHKGGIDVVYVALPMQAKESILDLLAKLADTTVLVYLLPDFFVFEIEHAHWVNLNGIPVVSVHETPFTSISGSLKRLEDILFGTAILMAAALPMLVIGLALKLSSPGPVIFRQKRYGLDCKPVHVWKFRSMTVCEEGDHVVQADGFARHPLWPLSETNVAR